VTVEWAALLLLAANAVALLWIVLRVGAAIDRVGDRLWDIEREIGPEGGIRSALDDIRVELSELERHG
jgi:hypothetical protein